MGISLRIVLAGLIAVMSLVIALVAFLPIYLSGLESMDSVMIDLRNSSVGRAREAFGKFLDVGRLQLNQAYAQINSGMVADVFDNKTAMIKWLVDTTKRNRGLISTTTYAHYAPGGNVTYIYCDSDMDPQGLILGEYVLLNGTISGVQLAGIDGSTYGPRTSLFNTFRPVPEQWMKTRIETLVTHYAPEIDAIQYPEVRYGWSEPVRLITSFVLGSLVELRDPSGAYLGALQAGMKTDDFTRVLQSLNLRPRAYGLAYEALSGGILMGTTWGEDLFSLTSVYAQIGVREDWERIRVLTLSNFTGNDQMKNEVIPSIGLPTLLTGEGLQMTTTIDLSDHGRSFLEVFEIRQTGMKLRVILVLPEIDFLEQIIKSRTASIAGTVSALVVTIVLGVLCAQLIVAPLLVLQNRMALTASFQDASIEGEEESFSFMSEVAGMQESYLAMRDELNRAKVYLPQSVLQAIAGGTEEDDDDEGAMGDHEETNSRPNSSVGKSMTEASLSKSGAHFDNQSTKSSRQNGRKYSVSDNTSRRSSQARSQHQHFHRDRSTIANGAASPASLNTFVSLQSKRVSIAVFNLQNFQKAPNQDLMIKVHSKFLELLTKAVRTNKGVVDYFQGDRVICSFNAVNNVAAHTRRAVQAALTLIGDTTNRQTHEGDVKLPPITVGVSSGVATVGNMGTNELRRFCVVGQVVVQALLLERLNKHFKTTHLLVPGFAADDLSTDFYVQHLGIVKLPRYKQADAPLLVTSIEGAKTGGNMDEWMYEMEEKAKKDPFVAVNEIFVTLLDEGPDAARKLVDAELAAEVSSSPSKDHHSSTMKPEEVTSSGGSDSASPLALAPGLLGGSSSSALIPSSSNNKKRESSTGHFEAMKLVASSGLRRAQAAVEASERSNTDFGTPIQALAECFF